MQSYKLIDLGREHYNGTVIVRDELALLKEIRKHLASATVGVVWMGEHVGDVIVGGMRKVGTVVKGELN